MTLTPDQIREGAAQMIAKAAREIPAPAIAKEWPDSTEAGQIQAAILTSRINLEWRDKHAINKATAVAVLASPLLIPLLAVLWLIWRIDWALNLIRDRRSRSSS